MRREAGVMPGSGPLRRGNRVGSRLSRLCQMAEADDAAGYGLHDPLDIVSVKGVAGKKRGLLHSSSTLTPSSMST